MADIVMRRALNRVAGAALSAALILSAPAALAQNLDQLKLAAGVVKAMEGYEAVTTKYIVANPTDIYSDHFMYGGKSLGQLKRGEPVEAIAKVKGYDWILVGKNGVGVGYVPLSLVSPANLYIP